MRVKQLIVRSGIIACGVILFGMLFSAARILIAGHPAPVIGATHQNGWTFVMKYPDHDPTLTREHGFFAFLRRLLGQSTEPADIAPWPGYASLLLTVPEKDARPDGETAENNNLTVQAVASTGDRFTLALDSPFGGVKTDRDVFVRLPEVPPAYVWMDVTVADKAGRHATWRVTDLPRLIHNNLGADQAGPITPVPGITMNARAYWDSSDHLRTDTEGYGRQMAMRLPVEAEILIKQKAYNPNELNWDAEDTKITEEWERAAAKAGEVSITSNDEGSSTTSVGTDKRIVGFAAPYPSVEHTIAINGKMVEHDRYTETLSFPNVRLSRLGAGWCAEPDNKVLTTPSGITVRLIPVASKSPGAQPLSTYTIEANHIYYRFEMNVNGDKLVFPASPLYQRHHLPLSVYGSLAFDNDQMQGETTYGGENPKQIQGDFSVKGIPASHTLATLKFTVDQDVALQSVSFHFVVPVAQGKPKIAWDGSDDAPCGCKGK